MKTTIYPIGTTVGNMMSLVKVRSVIQKRRFVCKVCGHIRRVSIGGLRTMTRFPGNTGCVRCNLAAGPGRAIPVAPGERFGCMEAVGPLPARTAIGEFRCVSCGHMRTVSAAAMNSLGERACPKCNARNRPCVLKTPEQITAKKAEISRRRTEMVRQGRIVKNIHPVRGTVCNHEKELICVDPGGVEIWRCRLCQPVGVPAWTAPLCHLGQTFSGRNDHQDEDNPSFENVVRMIEEHRFDSYQEDCGDR